MGMWDQYHEDLLDFLPALYLFNASAASDLAIRAGLPVRFLRSGGDINNVWMQVLQMADLIPGGLERLIDVAKKDHPKVPFPIPQKTAGVPPDIAPRIKELPWHSTALSGQVLEKVMGEEPTFLPIHFLETGIRRARCVVRVVLPQAFGTGFLITGNLLVTNNHVLPNEEVARSARIQFNYEETPDGLATQVAEFSLDPDSLFITSPKQGGDDWTAVQVRGDAETTWGSIDLIETEVKSGDFVNIIQHPHGMPKQIALYHNLVTTAGEGRVQYLTDTLPGSSGSPVFDSKWRVVAVHHSYGWVREQGTKQILYRNQGIAINRVIAGLNAQIEGRT